MQMKMEVLSENSDPSARTANASNAAQSGVRISQQAATPQQSTVLFTTPQQIIQSSLPGEQLVSHDGTVPTSRVRKNGLILQGTQIALQQSNGNVSIVHVQLPQSQSVIQPASHPSSTTQATTSVIQATSAGAIQNWPLQLKNPVILVNKSSVIQTAATGQQLTEEVPVHLVQGGVIGGPLAEDEGTRKRREVLARRPSYRKILNDLSMPQQDGQTMGTLQVVAGSSSSDKDDTASDSDYQLKPSTIQLQTTSATTAEITAAPQYVQYSNDGQLFVPVTVSGVTDLQTYQLRPAQMGGSTPVVVTTSGVAAQAGQPVSLAEEAARKRELRLLKNREAAKECRRKKKDYIKCLENRVAILENQNATLIEELKALKDLYCKKSVNDM